jgi:selenoprotein W-related protein
LTDKLLNRFKTKIKNYNLVPSMGGCFELTVDGDLIYSKLKTGKFPDEQEMIEQVAARLTRK